MRRKGNYSGGRPPPPVSIWRTRYPPFSPPLSTPRNRMGKMQRSKPTPASRNYNLSHQGSMAPLLFSNVAPNTSSNSCPIQYVGRPLSLGTMPMSNSNDMFSSHFHSGRNPIASTSMNGRYSGLDLGDNLHYRIDNPSCPPHSSRSDRSLSCHQSLPFNQGRGNETSFPSHFSPIQSPNTCLPFWNGGRGPMCAARPYDSQTFPPPFPQILPHPATLHSQPSIGSIHKQPAPIPSSGHFMDDLSEVSSEEDGYSNQPNDLDFTSFSTSEEGEVRDAKSNSMTKLPGLPTMQVSNVHPYSKKLVLLLDLDNTLLHATAQHKVNCELDLPDFIDENGKPELYKFKLPALDKILYYLKLRPGVRKLLDALYPYYDMSIYTNATREYADVVLSILDPQRIYFEDRIVARADVPTAKESGKAIRRIYPNIDPRIAVAFDDRKEVWMDIPKNQVLKAEHYDFFDANKLVLSKVYPYLNQPDGISLSTEKFHDCDRHLYHMTDILLELHRKFFEDPENACTGDLLESIRRSVLKGVGIYFTGFRKHSRNQHGVLMADCEELQKEMALELGARVYSQFDEAGVTHVVAGKGNTDNLIRCRDPQYLHLKKVHTLWLYRCSGSWSHSNEDHFQVDTLCRMYNNLPPTLPYRDHWQSRAISDSKNENSSPSCTEGEISSNRVGERLVLNYQEFLGTGPYSDGAIVISPFEEIAVVWRPAEQKLRQNFESEGLASEVLEAPVLREVSSVNRDSSESQIHKDTHSTPNLSNVANQDAFQAWPVPTSGTTLDGVTVSDFSLSQSSAKTYTVEDIRYGYGTNNARLTSNEVKGIHNGKPNAAPPVV